MKPLFTIHGGDFIIGDYIQKNYGDYDVWVPAKDRGIDLLIVKKDFSTLKAIQVKSSRSYPDVKFIPTSDVESRGWFQISSDKLRNSPSKFWIFVLMKESGNKNFIIIEKSDLLKKLISTYSNKKQINMYLTIFSLANQRKVCYDLRGINKADIVNIHNNIKKCPPERDYTTNLDNWGIIF